MTDMLSLATSVHMLSYAEKSANPPRTLDHLFGSIVHTRLRRAINVEQVATGPGCHGIKHL